MTEFSLRNYPTVNFHSYIPRIEHGPRFVYESAEQQWARTWLNMAFRGELSWRFSWRDPGIRWHLRALLDPNYVHPKAKRKGS